MLTPLRRFGDRGEDIAAEFLRKKGYRILERQVRVGRLGEIDLLCRHGGTLVFVEVKTRASSHFGTPEEAVGSWKRARFRRAMLTWLHAHTLSDAPFRADVIAIELRGAVPVIRHYENVEL